MEKCDPGGWGGVTSAHRGSVNTFLSCSGGVWVYVTGLLAAHVAFLLGRFSGTVALLQAVLHAHGLRADLRRSTHSAAGRRFTHESDRK